MTTYLIRCLQTFPDRSTAILSKTTARLPCGGPLYFLQMTPDPANEITPRLRWDDIDDVLLDMDGTLLDRHFDNFFFEEELPRRYAALHGLPFEVSRERLMAMYRTVEGELAWTDLHYWTERVGIDVVALHKELTNAHKAGVAVKSAKTGLARHVDRIVDAFEVGYLKMRAEYWPACRRLVGFDPTRSLYVDDDESCLLAAKQFGIHRLVHSAKSSTQLAPVHSASFASVERLSVLFNGKP